MWEIDTIEIVRENSLYFIPQIKTKILNEGWASFWHYKILHDLKLPDFDSFARLFIFLMG